MVRDACGFRFPAGRLLGALVVASAWVGALGLPGCSLAGLADFEAPRCQNHGDCALLNERHGLSSPLACELYQCDAALGACVRGPRDQDGDRAVATACGGGDCDDGDATVHVGAVEVCDGSDNDCDGLIDEEAGEPSPAVVLLADATSASWLSMTSRPGGGALWSLGQGAGERAAADLLVGDGSPTAATATPWAFAMAAEPGPAGLFRAAIDTGCPVATVQEVPPPSSTPVGVVPGLTCGTHAECDDGVFCNGYETCEPDSDAADERGCRSADRPLAPGNPCSEDAGEVCEELARRCLRVSPGACSVAAAELAPASAGTYFGAVISPTGCPAGSLRVGYLGEDAFDGAAGIPGLQLMQRGDHRRSNVYLGIDVGADGIDRRCTGHGRPEGAPLGARGLALAALPANPGEGRRLPQALVGFLEAGLCRDGRGDDGGRCGEAASLELLGLYLEHGDAMGTDVLWVSGSGDGTPTPVAVPAGRTTVGPALVAFEGDGAAGYVLAEAIPEGVAVLLLPALPDPDGVAAVAPYPTTIDLVQARSNPPLQIPAPTATLPTSGDVLHLSLAAGAATARQIPVALAITTTTGLHWARPTLDVATGVATGLAVERITEEAVGDVAVVHLASGLTSSVMAGVDGRMNGPGGGFVLLYTLGDAVVGHVYRDVDPAAVSAFSVPAQQPRHPHAFVDAAGRTQFGYIDGNRGLVHHAGLCGEAVE